MSATMAVTPRGAVDAQSSGFLDETGSPGVVLVTTIDIGGGESQALELRRDASPQRVARDFVNQHGLAEAVVGPLTAHLREHLAQALQEEAAALEPLGTPPGRSESLACEVSLDALAASAPPCSPPLRAAPSCGSLDSLAESCSPTNVFERLYTQALAQQARAHDRRQAAADDDADCVQSVTPNKASAALAAGRTRGEFANYGEYLYIEGLSELERRRQRAARLASDRAAAETEGLSFRPQISDKARQLQARQGGVPAWRRLSAARPARRAQQLSAIHRENAQEAELAECTFRPKIDAGSAEMMRPRMRVLQEHNISAHEQLFQDAERRRARHEDERRRQPEGVTFRPALATCASMAGSLRSSDSAPPNRAHERLHGYHLKREKKLEAARRRQMTDASGQPLFQPKVNRRPAPAARASGGPVGELLYARRLEHAAHVEQLARREGERERAERAAPRVSARSEAILARLKARRFRQIFDFLDCRAAGELDLLAAVLGGSPRFSNLSAEIRKDVEGAALLKCAAAGLCAVPPAPAVLQDMHERIALLVQAHAGGGAGGDAATDPLASPAPAAPEPAAAAPRAAVVDAGQFARLMSEVVEQTRGVPRRYLLPDVQARDAVEEPTFRPAVNGKSASMARERWPACSAPVHEQLHRHAQDVQERKQNQRRIRELEEIAGCTFRPRLVSQQLARSGKALKLSQSMPAPPRGGAREEDVFDCSGRPLGLCAARSHCPAAGSQRAAASVAECSESDLTRQVEELERLLAAAHLDAGLEPLEAADAASVRTSSFSVAASS